MQLGFDWPSIPDVVVDARGRYVLATYDDKVWVTCLDPATLQVVWSNRELTFDSDETRLAPAPDGKIYVWQPERHSAVVLDEGGKQLGKIGARERPDAKVPQLEFTDAKDFLVDADGTFLMVVANRLQRFDAAGVGVHTWPQTGLRSMFNNKLQPLYNHRSETERSINDYEDSGVTYWKRRPLELYDEDVRGIFSGDALYLLSEYGREENAIGKFARDGRCLWSARIPDLRDKRPVVDGAGNVYAINEQKSRYHVMQVSADGKNVRMFADDWRNGGVVDSPQHLTALADGTIGLWDSYSELILLGPDGQVKYTSPKQQRSLDRDRADRQRKLDNDEEVD